jgi:cytochrome c-type biogenesis protein
MSKRFQLFLHSVFFVLGFTVIFVALGATATALGQLLLGARLWLQRLGGILVIVLGLHTMGLITLPFLYSEKRVHVEANPRLGYFSSFLVGLFFAAGWTPCLGPVLATMLTWAASSADLWQGVVMLTFYSLGFGIPFLLTGLLFDAATGWLRKLNRHMRIISLVSGVLLIGIGLLMLTDSLTRLSGLFGAFSLESTLGEASISIPVAFVAGLLSFVSPCVLPLVPAYLGYMGSTSVSNPAPGLAGQAE